MGEVTACGSCGAASLEPLFDMGIQPLAEGGDGTYPLKLLKCAECSLVQLSFIPPPGEVFRPGHPYATGNTKALRDHFRQLAATVPPSYSGEVTVADIGAGDGTFLNCLAGGYRRIAVEPTDQIDKAPSGIIRYKEFFTRALAARIRADHGRAGVITAANVLAHVPDVHDFLEGVTTLLAPGGEFITENHDLASITEGCQFDAIYHEHLRYYSVASLSCLLEKHGFRIISSEPVPAHGGSFRVRARLLAGNFPANAETAAASLRRCLRRLREDGSVIYGIGATTRATPLIRYAGIADCIACVCEVSASDKIGTRIPGTGIPVVDEQALFADQPAYALLLAWHIAGDLIPGLRAAGFRGKFIIPLPEVQVILWPAASRITAASSRISSALSTA